MKTNMTLVVHLTYEHDPKYGMDGTERRLQKAVQHLHNEGLLSPEDGAVTVCECTFDVVNGACCVLNPERTKDIRSLLDYSAESEQRNYIELRPLMQNPKKHIWNNIKRLAKAIGHEL